LIYAAEELFRDACGDITVRCLFYVYDGRELVEVVVARRKCKHCSNIYHHEGQLAALWIAYKELLNKEKKGTSSTNTMHHYMDLDKDIYVFVLSSSIVDDIVRDLLFHDDKQLVDFDDTYDDEENPVDAACKKIIKKQNEKKNAMKLFCKKENVPVYTVIIRNVFCFDLTMDYVGIGMSFQQTTVAI
ncbi:hypothetical protein MARPO_0078s0044, partial [Marchantia polymorpha]